MSGQTVEINGQTVCWNGTGPFPPNITIAQDRVNQHRVAIGSHPNRASWHQKRICEITTVYPSLA